ncbi:DNA alkylation repair protein [uncultured Maribacter sp.]|uniref:DNA alkylation repair protein n=1 Tax=uncultured Maribacter sp. TaxID=431308 RepID=UPI00260C9CE4|nr:DNA alkylation repair protein [uncultured Maribacter sp.]
MQHYLETLTKEFEHYKNAEIALQQKAYVRNQFEYFGLKTAVRRGIQKPFLVKEYLPLHSELKNIIEMLWEKPQREFQHFGQELVFKYVKRLEIKDIALFEFMIINKSWWDTVDFIAVKLLGAFFKIFPEQRKKYIEKWLLSNNIWLKRSALLFQLKYKDQIDTKLLSKVVLFLLGSKEFFINKAIGWVLREYSRTNPTWVVRFVETTELNPLSRREALRLM